MSKAKATKATKAATKPQTGLAIRSSSDIPAALDMINAKIASIEKEQTRSLTTAGKHLPNRAHICDMDNSDTILEAYAFVMSEERSRQEAAEDMGIKKSLKPLRLEGHTCAEWKKDLKNRYGVVVYEEELTKLGKAKAELEKHLSKEDQLANSLSSITDMLTD